MLRVAEAVAIAEATDALPAGVHPRHPQRPAEDGGSPCPAPGVQSALRSIGKSGHNRGGWLGSFATLL